MPYILHYHDDTHDKPDRLDEELAHLLICSSLTTSVCARWRELAERRAGVPGQGRKVGKV